MSESKKKYIYIGGMHIHSAFSDGSGNIEIITKAAKSAGLDWIIVSDHNCMEIEEGIINNVTVITGEEISPLSENHYLALGISKAVQPHENPQTYINEVREHGGFGFAAHPDDTPVRNNSFTALTWKDKNKIPDGVEIWNWLAQWGDMYNDKTVFNVIYSYFFRDNLVKEPYRETIEWWDKLNLQAGKIVPATGGLDTHGLKVKKYGIPLTIFPYKSSFKTIANAVVLDEPLNNNFQKRKNQILNALKNGNNMIINRKVSKKIPDIFIRNNNTFAYCGESVKLDENTFLNINSQKNTEIAVFKDTKCIKRLKTDKYILKISETGKYRIELKLKNTGFCYTNPILVEDI